MSPFLPLGMILNTWLSQCWEIVENINRFLYFLKSIHNGNAEWECSDGIVDRACLTKLVIQQGTIDIDICYITDNTTKI